MTQTRETLVLDAQSTNLENFFGVQILSERKDRITAGLSLAGQHLAAGGKTHGVVVGMLADCAVARGAALNCPDGFTPTTVEAVTRFFRTGHGNLLTAEAVPVHVDSHRAVWRTRVSRGEDEAVAEVTHTVLYVPQEQVSTVESAASAGPKTDQSAAPLPAGVLTALERPGRARRGAIVEERRRQIFEAACSVIAEKGFAKATIREIAAVAEMPVPTMYQYLERKEDLLYGIYEYFMQDLVGALQKWRSSTVPPHKKIEGAIRTMVAEFDKNQEYIKILFQETRALTPEARQKVYDLDSRYIGILRELVEEATQKGEGSVDRPELTANFIYFLCVIWPLRYWTIGKLGEETVTQEIVAFILRGLGLPDNAKKGGDE